jgi:hypothetical protein
VCESRTTAKLLSTAGQRKRFGAAVWLSWAQRAKLWLARRGRRGPWAAAALLIMAGVDVRVVDCYVERNSVSAGKEYVSYVFSVSVEGIEATSFKERYSTARSKHERLLQMGVLEGWADAPAFPAPHHLLDMVHDTAAVERRG